MALKIRLSRGGAKKRPVYRIVVADSRMPRDGRFIEKLGRYTPTLPKDHEERVVVDLEAAEAWIKKGAKPSDRVQRLLAEKGLGEWTHGNNPNKGEPGQKAKERAAEKAEAEAAAAEAAAAPVEEAPAEEAPAEEAPAEDAAAE